MSKNTNHQEGFSKEDNETWQIGYYLMEFLRHGNQYHDGDMLVRCLPYPLNEKAREILKIERQ